MPERRGKRPQSEYDSSSAASDLVNQFARETLGRPLTVSLTRLGLMVVEALDKAYEAGKESVSALKEQGGEKNA